MSKKTPAKVSECVGAGRVVIGWLLEAGQTQLAYRVGERIVSLNHQRGYDIELPELGLASDLETPED